MTRISKRLYSLKRVLINWGVLLSFVAILFIAILVFFVRNERDVALQKQRTVENWSLIVPAISKEDHILGSIAAPVQLIVYSDFECVYCKYLYQNDIPKLRKEFGDSFVVAFRHRVLKSDPASAIEEEASECVAQAGGSQAFWAFANNMFAQPKEVNKKDPNVLKRLAEKSGAQMDVYTACMDSGEKKQLVNAQTLEAAIAGITVDPSVVFKTSKRALIVQGERYTQFYTALKYLHDSMATQTTY